MYIKLGLFINGKWKYNSEKYSDVINPADESILEKLPHATKDDLQEAVESSSEGFKVWRNISPEEKGDCLIRVGKKLKEKKDQMSKIMTLEQGKITLEASLEIDRAIDAFQYNGERAKKIGDYVVADRENGLKTLIKPHPVGVTLGLTAWNFPIILIARKLAPALAAGCSMIIKASEETPGTAVLLCKILEEAGLPKGVVNLVFGVPSEISDFLFKKNEIQYKKNRIGSYTVFWDFRGDDSHIEDLWTMLKGDPALRQHSREDLGLSLKNIFTPKYKIK